ncbi:MAG: SMC-Scp complex subunit ScpB [Lachnospiraceae bacterium]|jgi:segregation and condensation protein B|nr:SMC-Scp complex subunit ScpB [Lachnospiraceae bacterium]MEE3461091.1 SMC-Scp complex subunit ScpB [Lachnospiraceae bacterium]
MKLAELEASIEAILFTMGEAVELGRIAAATGQDEDTVRKVLHKMMDGYEKSDHGIQIIELDGSFQMCTKAEMYDTIINITHVPKKHVLTDTLLETLSIVAYKQPVTKLEIERIRGVKSDFAVNKLIEYNLICEKGRLDAPGRPILFGTTEEFLRNFGIGSLKDLPEIDKERVQDFEEEAQAEVEQLHLDL